jgi:hypothetical protein
MLPANRYQLEMMHIILNIGERNFWVKRESVIVIYTGNVIVAL